MVIFLFNIDHSSSFLNNQGSNLPAFKSLLNILNAQFLQTVLTRQFLDRTYGTQIFIIVFGVSVLISANGSSIFISPLDSCILSLTFLWTYLEQQSFLRQTRSTQEIFKKRLVRINFYHRLWLGNCYTRFWRVNF